MNDQSVRSVNHLLHDMPADVQERLRPGLEFIDAPLEMPLYQPYEKIKHVYFPVNSMASIVAITAAGESIEIGVVGSEGAVGLEVLMGADASPHRSMIQIGGKAYRIGRAQISEEFRRGGDLHDRILHFVQKLSVQVSQTTLCNRLHTINVRLARWLLMCHDRIEGDVLLITQEFIALMLGTSRVSVTQAAQDLQSTGHIKYVRGKITIVDRAGLEAAACSCYGTVKREYDRQST